MPKTKRILIPMVLIAALTVGLAVRYLRDGASDDPHLVRVSGNIEVTDAELGFKIAGKVQERLASEGERIEAGQIIARLDDADLVQEAAFRAAELRAAQAVLDELEAGSRPEEIAQAAAAVRAAKARVDELEAGSRPQEITAAEAAVAAARTEKEHCELELERHRRLLADNAISQGEFDRSKADYDRAVSLLDEAEQQLNLIVEGPRQEQIQQARAVLREAEEHLRLVEKGPREETIEQARARVEQARAALGLADTRLGYATLRSPMAGLVLSDNVEPGEYVAPGAPVVTVGDLENVWLRAYINETDLGRVRVGLPVRVTTDTYPGKVYEGTLSFIASEAEFTPKNVQTREERVKLVYRVKIDLANPRMELKPGMPADAEILIDQGES